MQILIILEGRGGELDRQTIDVGSHGSSENVSKTIIQAMLTWILAPGDVIRIEEIVG